MDKKRFPSSKCARPIVKSTPVKTRAVLVLHTPCIPPARPIVKATLVKTSVVLVLSFRCIKIVPQIVMFIQAKNIITNQ